MLIVYCKLVVVLGFGMKRNGLEFVIGGWNVYLCVSGILICEVFGDYVMVF